ncbi:energy-coupling factor transport system substrate-specific component [Micromonospora kangleipakensis]|uniref:Energy-coupling factor transport system substrate-specific component n=1 Tax=Micromonospora kangleipakensis TaxID=1077942 RepID=A0A4Q8BJF8_9ACTN|nr:ECF transporter S component [Micromonospora kangleipakensis]RZU77563.1 energy-coupling factor transport system substrate-specific component [Micromonospora kangleipakensis]
MDNTANRWRTIDIVIASVLGVAFGVIFWAWGLLWNGPADAIPLPGRAVLYGVWLVPAVLGALIIRKPGAAFFTLTFAALVSVALGSSWGWTLVVQGPLEAAAAELAFAAFGYRSYRLPVALLAATLAGLAASIYDVFIWYPGTAWGSFRLPYILITAVSSLVVAGLGSVALTRALAGTGVLDRFPAGRERAAI